MVAWLFRSRNRGGGGRAMHGTMNGNVKTALVLATVALVFFIGVMIRHWIW